MGVTTYLKCPDCQQTFPWSHDRRGESVPDDLGCPYCQGEEKAEIPFRGAPFLKLGNKAKSVDSMYRGMEESSRARAELAAEMVGDSPGDPSIVPVTNMKDSVREGDTTAIATPANNPVAAYMQQHNQQAQQAGGPPPYGFVGGVGGVSGSPEGADAVQKANQSIKTFHQQQGREFIAAGTVGSYTKK